MGWTSYSDDRARIDRLDEKRLPSGPSAAERDCADVPLALAGYEPLHPFLREAGRR